MLKIYNTLTRKKEVFRPISENEVGMYSCGPTVYNYVHIGNLRTYIFSDILKRVLIYMGYEVRHVMNITDVGHLTGDVDTGEDKMLLGAKREGKTVWEIAEFYTEAFRDNMRDLNISDPSVWCKATDHIPQQIALIEKLEKKGFAYFAGGNVYFDTSKLSDYGKLSGLDISAEQEARVERDPNKRNSHDFVLWFTRSKFQDQDMKWESPWGIGYPGWHIECSAMSTYYLGQPFDIHTGGIDHIQIHHTNEIAQSEAGEGKKMVQYWMHGEFLVIDNSKMAKSEGNFITLEFFKSKGYDVLSYRFFCLQTHYRQQLNFTWEALLSAQQGLRHIYSASLHIKEMAIHATDEPSCARAEQIVDKFKADIQAALCDDINSPQALAALFDFIKTVYKEESDFTPADYRDFFQALCTSDRVFGLGIKEVTAPDISKEIQLLVEEREKARREKKWKHADDLRTRIEEKGYMIEDTPRGSRAVKI